MGGPASDAPVSQIRHHGDRRAQRAGLVRGARPAGRGRAALDGAMADAQYRATQAAVLDQELAGIDVVTGGEMHRRTHNRHAPPNAMLNYFWQKIPAFQGSTRPKPITPHDPQRLPSGGDLPRAHRGQCRSRPGRRIQDGVGADAQAGQDHHDRAAHAGQGRLRRALQRHRRDDGRSRQAAAPQFQDAGRGRLQAHPDRRAAVHDVGRRGGAGRGRRHQHRDRGASRTTSTSRPTSARATTRSARNTTRRSATAISTPAATRPTSSARSNARPI